MLMDLIGSVSITYLAIDPLSALRLRVRADVNLSNVIEDVLLTFLLISQVDSII